MFWVIFTIQLLGRVSDIIWRNRHNRPCFRLYIYSGRLAFHVRVCLLQFLLRLLCNGTWDIISPLGLFNNTIPFTVSLPLHFPFLHCLPLLFSFPFPFSRPILCSVLFSRPFLTALHVLPTHTVVIVINIASTTVSSARCSGIRPVLVIFMVVNYLIPIQWSNSDNVTWLVLPPACQLNLCPEIISTTPRESLGDVFNVPLAGSLWIGVIYLIPEGMRVIPPSIVHLVVAFVKYLPKIWVEGCPALPKWRTPAPTVQPHQLELWKVASPDWIKKNYIIKNNPCPLILDATNIVYPHESVEVIWDEYLYKVPIE